MKVEAIVQADAFALPFADESFDTIVADPPYIGRNRGKKGIKALEVGYIPFRSYDWLDEAWRVLRPSGALYVVCAIRELAAYLRWRQPVDVISWVSPNSPSLAAYWRRGTGNRAAGWRPILHYQKEPQVAIVWPPIEVIEGKGRKRNGEPKGSWVDPNFFIASTITSQMHEAMRWPNQLPYNLIRWLLRPHAGRVLDLFAGTGTTRAAAGSLGLEVVSVDLSPQAIEISRSRGTQLPLGTERAQRAAHDRDVVEASSAVGGSVRAGGKSARPSGRPSGSRPSRESPNVIAVPARTEIPA